MMVGVEMELHQEMAAGWRKVVKKALAEKDLEEKLKVEG